MKVVKMYLGLLASLLLLIPFGYGQQQVSFSKIQESLDDPFSPRIIHETEDKLFFLYRLKESSLYIGAFSKADLSLIYQHPLAIADFSSTKELIIDWRVKDGQLIYFVLYDHLRDNQFEVIAHRFYLDLDKDLEPVSMYKRNYKNSMSKGIITAYLGSDLTTIMLKDQVLDLVEKTVSDQLLIFDENYELKKTFNLFKGQSAPKTAFTRPFVDLENSLYFLIGNKCMFLDASREYELFEEEIPMDALPVGSVLFPISGQLSPEGNPVFILGFKPDLAKINYFNFGEEIRRLRSAPENEGFVYAEYDPLNSEWTKLEISTLQEQTLPMGYFPLGRGINNQSQLYQYTPEDYGIGNDYVSLRDQQGNLYNAFALVVRMNTQAYFSHRHHDHIINAFDAEGKLKWATSMLYFAATDDDPDEAFILDDYYEFKLIDQGESLYLLINDHPENLRPGLKNYRGLEPINDFDEVQPVLVKIDKSNGAFQRIPANELTIEDYYLNIGSFYMSQKEGEYYFFVTGDDEFALGHWKLK